MNGGDGNHGDIADTTGSGARSLVLEAPSWFDSMGGTDSKEKGKGKERQMSVTSLANSVSRRFRDIKASKPAEGRQEDGHFACLDHHPDAEHPLEKPRSRSSVDGLPASLVRIGMSLFVKIKKPVSGNRTKRDMIASGARGEDM